MCNTNNDGSEPYGFGREVPVTQVPDLDAYLAGGLVKVNIADVDGNVFGIIGAVRSALRKAGYKDEATVFVKDAYTKSTYDEVLQLAMTYVDFE